MLHNDPSPLAGTTVRIKEHVTHAQVDNFGGAEFRVEDWWDCVSGDSWMNAKGNPACLVYAMRTGSATYGVPMDDEVLYGKVGGFGHLLHISELEDKDTNATQTGETNEPTTS